MKKIIINLICVIAFTTLLAINQFSSVFAQEFVKSDFMVSDLSDYFYKSPQLSVNEMGEMVVVWETIGTGSIWFKTVSSLGTQLGEEKLVPSANSTMEPRVAYADSGNFMVMYGGYYGSWSVYGQVYDRNGNEIGDTLELQRNTSEMMNMTFASLFADQNNHFGALFSGMDSMMVEKISGSGEFVGNTIILNPELPYTHEMRGAMTRSGQFIMVWHAGFSGDIRGQRYTPEGIPIGESFLVGQIDGNSNLQDFTLDSDTSGNFAVVWATWNGSKGEIYSQLFSAEGVSVGSNTRISEEQSNFEVAYGEMSIDMDVDGKIVIAWPDTRGTDTSFIYLQQLDKLGVPVGGNYRATTINNDIQPGTSLPKQIDPSVKILRDTIYLAWANYNQDVSNRQDIFANIQKWMPDYTGLDQQINTAVQTTVYPNPSAGIFSLIMDREYSGRLELEVYNATGSLVKRETRPWSGAETTIDISGVPVGMYYINIKGDSFTSTTPLIIIK